MDVKGDLYDFLCSCVVKTSLMWPKVLQERCFRKGRVILGLGLNLNDVSDICQLCDQQWYFPRWIAEIITEYTFKEQCCNQMC